jgi:hypothetical protein
MKTILGVSSTVALAFALAGCSLAWSVPRGS